jgi:nitrite reductase (NADH) small subunit
MTWVDAGELHAVTRAKKTVIDVDGHEVLVLAHDGQLYAFANRCIHKDRELAKGVVLNGKLVCPGHQWAFELATGWEAIKERCQPVYPVAVVDGVVRVDVVVPVPVDGPAEAGVDAESNDGVPVDVARSHGET